MAKNRGKGPADETPEFPERPDETPPNPPGDPDLGTAPGATEPPQGEPPGDPPKDSPAPAEPAPDANAGNGGNAEQPSDESKPSEDLVKVRRKWHGLSDAEIDRIEAARKDAKLARRRWGEAVFEADEAKRRAKGLEEKYEAARQDAEALIDELLRPPDDDEPFQLESPPDPGKEPQNLGKPVEPGATGKAAIGPHADDESWRRDSLAVLKLPERIRDALEYKDIFTLGQAADWTAKHKFTDIDGIGTAAEKTIEDAFIEYWRQRYNLKADRPGSDDTGKGKGKKKRRRKDDEPNPGEGENESTSEDSPDSPRED